MSRVVVAVRVRPLNRREIMLDSPCVVRMKGNETILVRKEDLQQTQTDEEPEGARKFTFDHSMWSTNTKDPHFVDQVSVFERIGVDVLKNAFDGYNACIFAYGQTGSGKSYTMMGPEDDKGLIPRLCESIFAQINQNTTETLKFNVEVSYMEIYNEKVRDLLSDMHNRHTLQVREHKVLGPYVEGLKQFPVRDQAGVLAHIEAGNQARTVAATNMNAQSSRSHAIFTLVVTQSQYDAVSNTTGEKVSRISLVD